MRSIRRAPRVRPGLAALLVALGLGEIARAQDHPAANAAAPGAQALYEPSAPSIAPASDEPLHVMETFTKPKGFQVSCFAAEPRIAQPVCFWFARDGAVYVAESFRHGAGGVFDIRDHMDWLDDDVAARSVEDRVAMYHKHLGDKFGDYEIQHERIRILRDKDGDGRADWDAVFADGFKNAADGIGAGLLENKGSVYYTCIPNFWRLSDKDGDGHADERELLSTGWGIRVALLGHDMHGIQIGPDGRLYWSIGDRAFRVTTKEGKVLDNPFCGAVLRSRLDGSDLEIFATGLRNPQELAFDDHGNLWTGDNNSDAGDLARWVQVVEFGETGWRQAYQWLTDPNPRGPWMDERPWLPHFDGQAAYIVPPVADIANGPSGLACYPGTGLPDAYAGHFFLCNFSGSPDWSGVYTFGVTPKGAGFEATKVERFVWGPLATDCDFGLDGGLYVSDWVEGWSKTGKGRLWRFFEPTSAASEIVRTTKRLLMDGMTKRAPAELATLLAHPDRRVRQDAHLELASRGAIGRDTLRKTALDARAPLLARLHAIWGLGVNLEHEKSADWSPLFGLLSDTDAEVRAQAARTLGDWRVAPAAEGLLARLADASPRVRMYACLALAALREPRAFEPALGIVREIGEHDPVLRHAATSILWRCTDAPKLAALATDPTTDVRVAAVVALRRLASPEIARFLPDHEARVRSEAARAVYDVPIPGVFPALADMLGAADTIALDVRVPSSTEPDAFRAGNGLLRRTLHANFRIGGDERAFALAHFAADSRASADLRAEALDLLAKWAQPPGRDLFHGEWMPIAERAAPDYERCVNESARDLEHAPVNVQRAWIRLAAHGAVASATARITEMALDTTREEHVRSEALRALATMKPEGVSATLERTLFDASPVVRAGSIAAFAKVDPARALPLLENALNGALPERRVAYFGLAKLALPRVDDLLLAELSKLRAGLVPEEAALDLVLAAESRPSEALKAALAARTADRKADELLGPWLDTLYGGDASKGREVMHGKSELECMRCHTVAKEGGVVGPALDGLGRRATRLEIAESIVAPNRRFAPGYQGTIVFRSAGPPVEGTIIEDNANALKVRKSDATVVEIPKSEVESTKPGLSAMPTNLAEHLSRPEMRDLIEYLSSLTAEGKP